MKVIQTILIVLFIIIPVAVQCGTRKTEFIGAETRLKSLAIKARDTRLVGRNIFYTIGGATVVATPFISANNGYSQTLSILTVAGLMGSMGLLFDLLETPAEKYYRQLSEFTEEEREPAAALKLEKLAIDNFYGRIASSVISIILGLTYYEEPVATTYAALGGLGLLFPTEAENQNESYKSEKRKIEKTELSKKVSHLTLFYDRIGYTLYF